MMFGAATMSPVVIGIPQTSKKFIDFSIACLRVSLEVTESFEKTGYIMGRTRRPGKNPIVSKRR